MTVRWWVWLHVGLSALMFIGLMVPHCGLVSLLAFVIFCTWPSVSKCSDY